MRLRHAALLEHLSHIHIISRIDGYDSKQPGQQCAEFSLRHQLERLSCGVMVSKAGFGSRHGAQEGACQQHPQRQSRTLKPQLNPNKAIIFQKTTMSLAGLVFISLIVSRVSGDLVHHYATTPDQARFWVQNGFSVDSAVPAELFVEALGE